MTKKKKRVLTPGTSADKGLSGRGRRQFLPSKSENSLLIWGKHPVEEFLLHKSENISRLLLSRKNLKAADTIAELATKNNIPVDYEVDLTALLPPGATHQGVAARLHLSCFISEEQFLCDIADSKALPFIVALDSVQDPHNLGAILRTAAAAGVQTIILPKDRAAQITGTVVKASAGALAHLTLHRTTNLSVILEKMKKAGVWIYGAALGEESLYVNDFAGPVCLVIGNEQKGLRPLVKKRCDFLISIPLANGIDSLNASVAAGILIFEVMRRRGEKN